MLADPLDRLTAQLDLQSRAGRVLGDLDDAFDVRFGQVAARLIELHDGIGDLAVLADRPGPRARVGAGDLAHVRNPLDLREGRCHLAPRGGGAGTRGRSEDDRGAVPGLVRESLLEPIRRTLSQLTPATREQFMQSWRKLHAEAIHHATGGNASAAGELEWE